MTHILECSYLYDNAEIYRSVLKEGAQAALKSLRTRTRFNKISMSCQSVAMRGCRKIAQAAGRVGRTNMKSPVVRIICDDELFFGVDFDVLESCGYIFTPEFSAIVEHAKQVSRTSDTEGAKLRRAEIAANRVHMMGHTFINASRFSGWSAPVRAEWAMMRDLALRFPTPAADAVGDAVKFRSNHCVRMLEPRDTYRYTQEENYSRVEVHFGANAPQGSIEVSARGARLDKLMAIPGMKSYFEKMGWATRWERSEYIISPIIFNNIYKGALGEVCGRHILDVFGVATAEIEDPAHFEKFDCVTALEGCEPVFVDFKHWKRDSDRHGWDAVQLYDHVFSKMRKVGTKRAVIANILPPADGDYCVHLEQQGELSLLMVPAMVDENGQYNVHVLMTIKGFCQ